MILFNRINSYQTSDRQARGEAACEELAKFGDVRGPVLLDLMDSESITRAAEELQGHGPIDILINNAGFA